MASGNSRNLWPSESLSNKITESFKFCKILLLKMRSAHFAAAGKLISEWHPSKQGLRSIPEAKLQYAAFHNWLYGSSLQACTCSVPYHDCLAHPSFEFTHLKSVIFTR
jgi:hypothetical protein